MLVGIFIILITRNLILTFIRNLILNKIKILSFCIYYLVKEKVCSSCFINGKWYIKKFNFNSNKFLIFENALDI